jgi:hypothetical protein
MYRTLLSTFRASQEAIWQLQGGPNSGLADPSTLPVCALQQLTPQANTGDLVASGTCAGDMKDSGWRYVEGPAALTCPHQIIFTVGQPPPGATVTLVCQ